MGNLKDNAKIIEELAKHQYVLVPNNNYWCIKKIGGGIHRNKNGHRIFSHQLCIQFANELLTQLKANEIEWEAIVRYSRGLGFEHLTLPKFEANSINEANKIAEEMAEAWKSTPGFTGMEIKEIKVRPVKKSRL